MERVGARPLTAAVYGGHEKIVQFLLDVGANPNLQDTWRSTPPSGTALESACQKGHLAIAKFLIAHGADVNKQGYWKPLKSAASYGHAHMVEFLLANGASLEADVLGQAASRSRIDVVKLLVGRGADVNAVGEKRKRTPLHVAARREESQLVSLLLASGAKVNVRSDRLLDEWRTPLHQAAMSGRAENVRLLLEAGARPALRDRQGKTAEDWARAMKKREVAKVFRELWGKKRRFAKSKLILTR